MPRQYSFHDGELRIYDGTATPFCYRIKFVQTDPQVPANRPRAEQRLILDRGRISSDMKYVKGPEDVVLAPIDFTFAAKLDEALNRNSLWQALICGTVGSHNWVTTAGTSQVSGVTLKKFDNDAAMQLVNVEIRYTGATTNWGRRLKEVFFPPEMILFGPADPDGIGFSATGRIYGPITSMSAFTTPNTVSTGGAGAGGK